MTKKMMILFSLFHDLWENIIEFFMKFKYVGNNLSRKWKGDEEV